MQDAWPPMAGERRVFKWVTDLHQTDPLHRLTLPSPAKFLHAAPQNPDNAPFNVSLWFECPVYPVRREITELRHFVWVGTGHEVPIGACWLASHVWIEQGLVFHLYEL